jgi:glutathione peroxidase
MHTDLKDKGLEIMCLPSNSFDQEQGSSEQIEKIARGKFKAEFPIFEKMDANGKEAHPVFVYLRQHSEELHDEKRGYTADLPWSWSKFLVDADGQVVQFYEPEVYPETITPDVKRLLKKYS